MSMPAEEEEEDQPQEEQDQVSSSSQPHNSDSSSSQQQITLPALGESVTEGTVTRWLVEVGDTVAIDDPLLEVSTDKVDTEVPSPVAGVVEKILVEEDEDVEVGALLAIIGQGTGSSQTSAVTAAEEKEDEEPAAPEESKQADQRDEQEDSQAAAEEESAEAAASSAQSQVSDAQAPSASSESGSVYVTPLVRKLAKQEGIDLSSIKGSGVGGRIRKQDIQAAVEARQAPAASRQPASAQAAAPATAAASQADSKPQKPSPEASAQRGSTQKATRIRQTIAKRMVESLQTSAQLTQFAEVDLSRLVSLRNKAKDGFAAREGAKLTFLPFFAKAVTEALQQYPQFNATMSDDLKEITYHGTESLGIAADTPKGLLVPVIHDAGDLNVAGLAKKIQDVGNRARSGQIGPDELSGSTFTISNIGQTGGVFFTPIINQPNVAILGIGGTVKRPVVVEDAEGNDVIAIRSMTYLSLTYDHRVIDGADAGRFLHLLKTRLEGAAFEADLGL